MNAHRQLITYCAPVCPEPLYLLSSFLSQSLISNFFVIDYYKLVLVESPCVWWHNILQMFTSAARPMMEHWMDALHSTCSVLRQITIYIYSLYWIMWHYYQISCIAICNGTNLMIILLVTTSYCLDYIG